MTKEEAKRFAEVLLAYSRGEPVQVFSYIGWVTVGPQSVVRFDLSPENYRLPPRKITCRLWLYADNCADGVVCVVQDRPDLDCEAFAKHTPGFVRWLDDWQEVEA